MFIKRISYLIFSLVMFISALNGQGYKIDITVNNLKDTTVILGHYLNKSMYPDDTINIDQNGQGVFQGSNTLPGGLYVIYLPNALYFEVLIGDDQFFSIQTDTSDFINTLVYTGSDENQIFLEFQRFMATLRKKADSLSMQYKIEQDNIVKEELMQDLQEINNARIKAIESIAEEHHGLFVADFLKSTLEVQVPDPPRDENGNIIDSSWQYYYYKNHFFDNFDLADPRLLRTPLYEDKIIDYITNVLPQIPDTISKEVDKIIEISKSDSTLFRYVMVTLFNYFGKSNIMGMDAVQMDIAEKHYIPESWWSDSSFIADLKIRVEKTKPLLIGKIAPDIELMSVPSDHFIAAANDTSLKKYPHVGNKITLHQVDADFVVLVFWEADCGHCQTAIPELYDIFESNLNNSNVKVLAISTLFGEEGKAKWSDFVNEHHLYNWINAWNPYSYEYKLTYDILTTPQIYILDKQKKIIAKKISPAQVEEIIESLTNI